MTEKELESDKKLFDIYLHLHLDEEMKEIEDVDEEMKVIIDVSVEDYDYEQLLLDAHDLALFHFPKCSKESVFVSHELMVRGRRCKSRVTCDYGLKKLFSTNKNAYVFFVKCYDGLPGLRLLGKAKKRSSKLSLAENVDSSDSDEDLIKQATSRGKNVPLASIAEVDEEQTNGLDDLTDNAYATHVYALRSMAENAPLAELAGKRRITTMVESASPTSVAEHAEEQMNELDDRTDNASATHVYALRSMVENPPLTPVSELVNKRRITRTVENVSPASVDEVDEERMMVSSNQMGDLTNHASVTQDYVTEGKSNEKVFERKRRKVSSSELAMLHREDMVARVDVPPASVSETAEGKNMLPLVARVDVPPASVSETAEDQTKGPDVVYVRKRKTVKQVV